MIIIQALDMIELTTSYWEIFRSRLNIGILSESLTDMT